jgi:hypothetical protein
MDVVGLAPTNGRGEYFRASIWSWFPIWDRLAALCGDFLDERLLRAMTFNDGAGPGDQATCDRIAERLERWLAEDASDRFSRLRDDSSLRVTLQGKFVSDEDRANDPQLETKSPYSVARAHVQEFVQFLRNCGGFSVC